jgi:anti-sigma regulatory factor (Ser/Thr protein kinase)
LSQLQVQLDFTVAAPAQARSALRTWLRLHHPAASAVELALLVVSELVTNSVRHASASVDAQLQLSASLQDHALRIQVRDPGTEGTVARRTPQFDGAHIGGYGLDLVTTIATTWGVERDQNGTNVWAQLPV